MKAFGIAVVLGSSALSMAAPKEPVQPVYRVVVAEANKLLESEFQQKIEYKRRELEGELEKERLKLGLKTPQQQNQALLNAKMDVMMGKVPVPTTPEDPAKVAEYEKKTEAAKKQLEAFAAGLRIDLVKALKKDLEPKLKNSKVDYLLDVAVALRPSAHIVEASQIRPQEQFFPETVATCRPVRLNFEELTTKTKTGAKLVADLTAAKAKLEKAVADQKMLATSAEADWKRELQKYERQVYETLSAAWNAPKAAKAPLCLIHATVTAKGEGVVAEPKSAPLAKVADSTAWFVANLDLETQKLADAEVEKGKRHVSRKEAVGLWVERLPKLGEFRGAAVKAPPAGWKEAFTATEPFEAGVSTLVGTDAEGLPRVQMVYGSDLELEAAKALRVELYGAIDEWAEPLGWQADSYSAPEVPAAFEYAGVWVAADEKEQRKNGTWLLTIERQPNKKFRVVVQLAEAQLPWPLK